jgi:hypothetical protein
MEKMDKDVCLNSIRGIQNINVLEAIIDKCTDTVLRTEAKLLVDKMIDDAEKEFNGKQG